MKVIAWNQNLTSSPTAGGLRLVSEEDQRKRRTVSRLRGSRGFVGARDPKFPHAGIQGSALDSQTNCGTVRTHDYAACLLQCPANVLTIQILKSDGLSRRVDLCARSQSSQGATKSATGCEYYAALDEVLRLSDISRPRIGGKGVHHFRSNPFDYFLHSCSIFGDKVCHQQRDVFCAVSQWGHRYRKYVEAVVEIAAKQLF